MSWTDYKQPSIDIPLSADGSTTAPVFGLDLDDISTLVGSHLESMMALADLYRESQGDVFAGENLAAFLVTASRTFPEVSKHVLALGTRTPEVKTMKFPVSIEMAALAAILKLTLEDAGGLGNLLAMLGGALKGAANGKGPASQKLRDTLSQFSTMDSGKTQTS